MKSLKIDFTKSVEQNAETYFQKAKLLRKKILGAEEAIAKSVKKLSRLKVPEKAAAPKHVSRRKEWYEKFRWFVSSEGFLVIGGRDAATNEIVIKKHAAPNDLVLHTDMAGSPFMVIKAESKTPGETTIREAADAVASFSRAWQRGLPFSDVFVVSPEQVTKHAQPGEFLPRGAFMIRGKVRYIDNKVGLAIGLYKDAVMSGPLSAVKAHCDKVVKVVPGDRKTSDVAKSIKKLIGGDLDEIIRSLPAGGCDIKE